jgi:osmotically-inducible protein OsmY
MCVSRHGVEKYYLLSQFFDQPREDNRMKTDQDLKNDVLAELAWDPRLHSNEIGVIAKDGAVTLTGMVRSYAERLAAERAAKRVKGVRAIAQAIEVKLPEQIAQSDEGIAERIARLLTWNSTFRNTNVLAEVRRGYVTLTGEVEWPHQSRTAEQRVGELEGVVGIANCIKVRERTPPVTSRDVARQITRALHRHASVEASNVHVSVTAGKVTLEGTIPTYPERELVEEAVWATAGVKAIEDHLKVE